MDEHGRTRTDVDSALLFMSVFVRVSPCSPPPPFCYHPRPEVFLRDTKNPCPRSPAAPRRPARRGDARLLPLSGHPRRHHRLHRRGRPLEGGPAGRRGAAADDAPGRGVPAAISPDGRTIAFSASYEGPTEVYTMPIDGGLPVRRTFEGEAERRRGRRLDAGRRDPLRDAPTPGCREPSSRGSIRRPAGALSCRWRRRATAPTPPTARPSSSPASPSRAATPSATRGAPPRTSGASRTATPRPCRSPPTTRAPASRRCCGRGASTSSPTATAR